MRRVTQGGDISFNVADVRGLGDNYAFRFYTTDSCKYIVKVDGDAVEDIIRLEWDELKTLGDGVLCYYADNLEPDEEYSDATFNRTFGGTTQWYIVTSCGGSGSSEEITELSDKLDAEIARSSGEDIKHDRLISANTQEIQRLADRLYTDIYTKEEVDQKIAEAEMGGELPSGIVIDANYVHTDNNFTTAEKNKLDGIATGAEVNVQADWTVTDSSSDAYIQHKPTIPQNTSDLTNDSNFVSDANYVHTDNNYTTTEKNNLVGLSTRVTTVETTLTNTYSKNETYSKTEVDDLIDGIDVSGDAVGVQSITQTTTSTESGGINVITSTLTNGTTTTFQIRNGLKGEKGDTGNVQVDGNGNVLVVNSLEEGGPDAALSAEMGKELNLDVNGREETVGNFVVGLYNSMKSISNNPVGSTFSDETIDSSYAFTGFRSTSLQLHAGDKIDFKARGSGYHGGVAITDTEKVILYFDGKSALASQTNYVVEQDGWLFISNYNTQNATPVAIIHNAVTGHEQRISTLESDVDVLKENVDELNPDIIDAKINGRDIRATFFENSYYNSGGLVVGDTFNPQSPNSSSGLRCATLPVKAGDNVIVVAMGSIYQYPVIITDKDHVVTVLEPKNTFVNKVITIEEDGYIYINNASISYTNPVCHIHNASPVQLVQSVMATLPIGSFVEGQSTELPIISGKFPYPNLNTYYMVLNTGGLATTPWLAIPRGTYILPDVNARIYQADNPLFEYDYAKIGDNIWSITLEHGGAFDVTHDYVMIGFTGSAPSGSVLLYCDKRTSNATTRKNVAHITHVSNGDFYIYLPMRDKYYCFVLTHYTSPNYLEHYGISNVHLCETDGFVYPQTLVTRASEYECAINIQGQDYIGGHMHGHEQIVAADTTIYINGESKTLADAFGEDVTGMFEMMTHTILYQTDNTTKVADIYKRWRVVDGKLHLYNRVVFAGSYHINRAQFSMFGIYRHIGGTDKTTPYLTCWASRNSDTRVYKTTDGWDTSSPTDGSSIIAAPAKATLQEQWGESGYIVRQEIFENNQRENGGMFINTNGGGEYNKMYFEMGSNFDVFDGDELFSHAILEIK